METSPRKGCDLIKVLFQMRAIPAEAGIYHAEAPQELENYVLQY